MWNCDLSGKAWTDHLHGSGSQKQHNNKLIYFFSMEADIPDLEMRIANEILIA